MAVQPQVETVTVTIDGLKLQVPKGMLLVEAAKQLQKEIPVYCYHTKLGPAGLCRICLVQIEGMPKLQIACNTPVTDGMVVHTYNDKVDDGRRAVLELLLKNHPLDCPICDKGGECDLQDFSMAYGQGASRLADPKSSKPKAVDLGPTIVLDEERCIVCQRCVRFDDIITREQSLVVKDRGHKDIIATATDEPYRSNFSGNVTELCPVGALTSKTYRFKSRPWDLHRTKTSCTQCSVGCQLNIDQRAGTLLRTMSVPDDDAISDGWLCDRGRYNIGFGTDARRINTPMLKQDGQWMQITWEDAISLWAKAIKDAQPTGGAGSVGVLGGGRLLNEEAYLLQHVFRGAGVHNLDWRSGRQRQASPGRNSGSLVALENAQAIIVAGQSPAETAPVLDLRIRKAVHRHGATLITIGAYEGASQVTSHAVTTVADAVKALPQGVERIAIVWDGVDAQRGRELASAMPSGTAVNMYIPGEQSNARGAEAMGMHPTLGPGHGKVTAGRDFVGMVEDARNGKMRVLSIFGANPVLHFADGLAAREALEKTPFVVVSDLFMTQTAELATLVLPACSAFEKSGTTMNLAGDLLPVEAAMQRPDGVLSDLEIIAALGEALGQPIPSSAELDSAIITSVAAAQGDFTLGDADLCGDAHALDAQRDRGRHGLHVCIHARIFGGGGTVAHDTAIEHLRPLPEAAISPATAARLGVQTGDCVDLEGGGRTMHDLLVEVRPQLPNDVVVLIAGLPDDPANLFGEDAVAFVVNVRTAQELEPAGMAQ
ncbi:MAG: molybdopterin-dependent oxidoreductase [Candidatus Eremiobacteraeota bacterium]|nr:molybdopterin-dependent oxidoreductase [Candidatus Eremiobacteraeota bacterium]